MNEPLVLLPAGGDIDTLRHTPDLRPFDAPQIEFAAALSRALTTSPTARQHPELMALGFWLRPAHLKKLIDELLSASADAVQMPRGLCLHIAPGNVDTIFVYSWMLSLLCGNRSIVRLSSRESAQTHALLATLSDLFAEPAWAPVAQRVLFLRYGHDEAITRRLSADCDMRIIWGGDTAVNAVRASPLPPHATELCFPDKFSMSVLRASAVRELDGTALAQLAKALCNDAYTFGQMACSSPRLVLWLGNEADTQAARTMLWPAVEARVPQMAHGLGAAEAMNKAISADLLALDADVHFEPGDPLVQRIWLDVPAVHAGLHCGGGLFHESRITQLDDLLPLLSRRVQTVSEFGFSRQELEQWARQAGPRGIDRVVPVGQALDFAPVWDGVNLWRAFLREIHIRC
ncbi:acyl-CoA reductase [Aquabacterium sp.]|uniref:acyl-CoA reductase n=1 Tax=Aquabacterium sp. TaxID=1872578 RepID=UPI002CE5DCD6|nr:acyl-CoA reductase [Aquabacterium sp.]HSW04734.1 acyl-CoA reductase [Aquabacterium sp.]